MTTDKNIEKEANLFAMLLLMPTNHIKADIDNMEFDFGDDTYFTMLCKKYEVTYTALMMRICYYAKFKK